MRYRRADITGAIYFFTVNLADRKSQLLTENIETLRAVLRKVQKAYPFEVVAMMVMPDHLHAIWRLPENYADFSLRWSLIKAAFSKAFSKTEYISASRQTKRERGIWQRRFWEPLIRDDNGLEKHVAYIHFNPVKHGYVSKAIDWPYSSIHKAIASGDISPCWAGET